jgi:hypothetical protein
VLSEKRDFVTGAAWAVANPEEFRLAVHARYRGDGALGRGFFDLTTLIVGARTPMRMPRVNAEAGAPRASVLRQLPQDAAVAGRMATAAKALNRPIGRPSHTAAVQTDIALLRQMGATDFRVNQWQTDISGNYVGKNRPDLQYTFRGRRYYREYEGPDSPRGAQHRHRITANDPTGIYEEIRVP